MSTIDSNWLLLYGTGDLMVLQMEVCALRVINSFSDRRVERSRLLMDMFAGDGRGG